MDPLSVIGIGADGWAGLDSARRGEILAAEVVVGGERHLGLLPDEVEAVRHPWPTPLRAGLSHLLAAHQGRRVVVLASGDPMVSGIGTTLIDLLGTEAVRIHPHLSAAALARARMGWSAERSEVVSLTSQPAAVVRRHLAPSACIVVLGADSDSPRQIAEELLDAGAHGARLDVWSDLGSADEEHRVAVLDGSRAPEFVVSPLTTTCVTCPPYLRSWPTTPGLPDDAYEHDGQLTKRDVRASALARLAPQPGELLWDVGAGAGSVGIEWMRTHPLNRTIAVESNPTRVERISRNAHRLGVPLLQVVVGAAPDAIDELDLPDAIFVGGGVSIPGMLDRCLDALRPGGRLVAHGVTVESESVLNSAHADHGGELTRLGVENLESLGSMRGFRPARTITQWSVVR